MVWAFLGDQPCTVYPDCDYLVLGMGVVQLSIVSNGPEHSGPVAGPTRIWRIWAFGCQLAQIESAKPGQVWSKID